MTTIKETDLSKDMRAFAGRSDCDQATADKLRALATEFDERSQEYWSAQFTGEGEAARLKRMMGAWARARTAFAAARGAGVME